MISTPSDRPTATIIVVLFKEKGGRWKTVGTAGTWAEAVALVNAAGDWWLRRAEPGEAQPSLFDQVEA